MSQIFGQSIFQLLKKNNNNCSVHSVHIFFKEKKINKLKGNSGNSGNINPFCLCPRNVRKEPDFEKSTRNEPVAIIWGHDKICIATQSCTLLNFLWTEELDRFKTACMLSYNTKVSKDLCSYPLKMGQKFRCWRGKDNCCFILCIQLRNKE